MRTNLWFGVMALAIIFTAFVSVPVSADDAPPKDEATSEVQGFRRALDELRRMSLLSHDSSVGWQVYRLRTKAGMSHEDSRRLDDLKPTHDEQVHCWWEILHLIYNDTAMQIPANVEEAKGKLAAFRANLGSYNKEVYALFVKYYPAADIVEPLRSELRSASHWRNSHAIEDDLRTMFAFADACAIYTEEDTRALDDLAIRFYRGAELGGRLYELLDDDGAMDKPANVEKVRVFLAEFKKVTTGWDDERHRLWHKVFDTPQIAEHEQRVKDAAKALDNPNPSQPK